MMRLKKLASLVLALVLCATMCVPAMAEPLQEQVGDNYTVISQEEYLQNYANYHGITYQEALTIDKARNLEIWKDYAVRNHLPIPRSIDYHGSEPVGNAELWYVTVSNTYDGTLVNVTYQAQGKVIVDRQGRTFVPGSFGQGQASTLNMLFSVDPDYRVTIGNTSYTSLYLNVSCIAQIENGFAANIVFDKLAQFGFSFDGSLYWRLAINDSHTELI